MARVFILLLVLIGIFLSLFTEYFYLRDQFGTRMNTVFKFFFQTWQYWSLAAAYGAISLGFAFRRGLAKKKWLDYWVTGGFLLTLLLFVMGSVYLPLAASAKTRGGNPQGPSLDASAYYDQSAPDDAAAIRWLSANAVGNGPVAEAVGGSYSEYARVATLTGIPDVLGWIPHEGQWRGGYREVGSRAQDIGTLFTTTDWKTADVILKMYQIRYVFYGELEYRDFGDAGIAKFQENLATVFQQGPVLIFERSVP
jgi:uncharacterized membrane protein